MWSSLISREMDTNENCILVSKKRERKGKMVKLVDATDLHWVEPWRKLAKC